MPCDMHGVWGNPTFLNATTVAGDRNIVPNLTASGSDWTRRFGTPGPRSHRTETIRLEAKRVIRSEGPRDAPQGVKIRAQFRLP